MRPLRCVLVPALCFKNATGKSFLRVSQADVSTLCKKTSWTERKVQVWFRRRRNQERAGLRKRFSEARCDAGRVM